MEQPPIRLHLDDQRRTTISHELATLYETRFDEPLSDFRATELIDFFLRHLGLGWEGVLERVAAA